MENEIVSVDVTVAFKYIKKDTSFTNKMIGWWTNSDFYHVELIIDNKWVSSNPDIGGVTISDLKPLNDNWKYCKLPTIELTYEQRRKIFSWIESQKDKKYDWAGIVFAQIFPFRLHDNNKWYCSEICSYILKMMMVESLLNVETGSCSPGDLARYLNFKG